ncbi:TPA: hypothetical protein ACH3X2_004227 [Trebouxia sp. C0005]
MQGKSWDLRWCVLTSSSLTYYRSLEDRDWGGAGTVLSLSSLKRFESISSLVFQLYFYQRILQLRAAQEQEAHRWILCLKAAQLQQQKLAADGPNLSQQVAAPPAAASSSPAPSPRHKSASAGGDGILLIHARANIELQDSRLCNTEARGVLPSHLLVEESRVSYSPLSEHAVASPFMSDALRQQFIDQAHSDGAARELGSQMDSRQATSSTATASDHQDEGADIGIRTSKTLTFAEPSTSHRSKPHHERSQSAGQALEQQQLAVTSRSASYQPSTSSPFDHATGGLFASEDIEQLYALPEGARAGRLHCSEDWEPSYDTLQQSAVQQDRSGHSSPLYLSCSSGSDAHDSNELSSAAALRHDSNSILGRGDGIVTAASVAAQSMQRDSSGTVFWVPELGSQSQSFTEYTKHQMDQTGAAGSVHREIMFNAQADRQQSSSFPQRLSAHAWTAPQAAAVKAAAGNFSSTWHGSFSAEEGPHPPLVPSPHAGWAHATTGFRGGVREDPRLRRFREARSADSQLALPHPGSQLVTSDADTHAAASLQNQSTSGHVFADVCNPRHPKTGNSGGSWSIESVFVDHNIEQAESTQDAMKDRGTDGKRYWRAPPSLAWGAPAVTASSSTAANVGWTEDSEETLTSVVSEYAQQVVNVVRRGSSQEWSGASDCGAF